MPARQWETARIDVQLLVIRSDTTLADASRKWSEFSSRCHSRCRQLQHVRMRNTVCVSGPNEVIEYASNL